MFQAGSTASAFPSRPTPRFYIKDAGLDSLVGGDGESGDVVLYYGEGLDRALPTGLEIGLSKQTIGGEIVDREARVPAESSLPGSGVGSPSGTGRSTVRFLPSRRFSKKRESRPNGCKWPETSSSTWSGPPMVG